MVNIVIYLAWQCIQNLSEIKYANVRWLIILLPAEMMLKHLTTFVRFLIEKCCLRGWCLQLCCNFQEVIMIFDNFYKQFAFNALVSPNRPMTLLQKKKVLKDQHLSFRTLGNNLFASFQWP